MLVIQKAAMHIKDRHQRLQLVRTVILDFVLGPHPGHINQPFVFLHLLLVGRPEIAEDLVVLVVEGFVDGQLFVWLIVVKADKAHNWALEVEDALLHELHFSTCPFLPRFDNITELPEAKLGWIRRQEQRDGLGRVHEHVRQHLTDLHL